MDNFLFKQLTNAGFSSRQINQITFILESAEFETVKGFNNLMELINPKTDVEVLRDFNKVLKDKQNYIDCFDNILLLVKENISFSEVFDISKEKRKYACILLQHDTFKRENLKYLKYENITERFIDDCLMEDLVNNDIDVSLYYRETFDRHDLHKARQLVEDGAPELVDKIILLKAIGISFNDMNYFKKAEKLGLDLINILKKTQNSDVARRVVDYKLEGIDITKYLDKLKKYSDTTLYATAVKNELNDRQIDKLINYGIKNIDYDALDMYIKLYKEGVDVQPFIENDCGEYFLQAVRPLKDKMDITLLANCEEFVVEFIFSLYQYGREELVDIVLNLEDPDEDTFFHIEKILEKDSVSGAKHKIINLFYDKGADTFEDYDYCYEFNSEQKSTLSYSMMMGQIDDKNIDLIRDNFIDADKMSVLADIIADGNDISALLNGISSLSVEDLEAAQICLRAGFELTLKERNLEKE